MNSLTGRPDASVAERSGHHPGVGTTVDAQHGLPGRDLTMALITPRALAQLKRFTAADQDRVIQKITGVIREDECRLVKELSAYRVFRFRVTRSIRVSFRFVTGKTCIIDICNRSRFDAFARHYHGALPNQWLTLKEFMMTKRPEAPVAATTLPRPTGALTSAALANETEFLVEGLLGIVAKAAQPLLTEVKTGLSQMKDELKERHEQACAAERSLKEQQKALQASQHKLTGRVDGLAAALDAIRDSDLGPRLAGTEQRLESLSDALHDKMHELASSTQATLEEKLAAFSHLGALSARLEKIEQEVECLAAASQAQRAEGRGRKLRAFGAAWLRRVVDRAQRPLLRVPRGGRGPAGRLSQWLGGLAVRSPWKRRGQPG